MFVFDHKPFAYSHPWLGSFADRLSDLTKGDFRVAYLYETPDTSTFRYRAYNMCQALTESKHNISAAYFYDVDIERLEAVIDKADVLIICRHRYNQNLNRLITKARNLGKKVFFDVDDLVFDVNYVPLLLNTLGDALTSSAALDLWFAYAGRLSATLALCDGAITTNEYLAARLREVTNSPTYVIPNFLNRQQMEVSHSLFKSKKESGFARNTKIQLGYFSGSPTHQKDFDIIQDALGRALKKDPRLTVRIVGFMDFKGPLRDYRSRIEFYPFQDWLNLQRLISEVEINLVPLQDNIFTNCKSELKYFEAAIVGTLTIASPIFTYAKAIKDGDNGWLANSYEWDEKIETALNSLDLYPDIVEKAYNHTVENYAWYNQVSLLEKTLLP